MLACASMTSGKFVLANHLALRQTGGNNTPWGVSPMSLRILLAAVLAATAAPAFAAPQPDQIVVFGDSLVDAGNVYIALGGSAATNTVNNPSAGYFPGRFTNGPDYTDLLDQRLYGHLSTPSLIGGNNYAFGGASVGTGLFPVPDLTTQVGLYTAGHAVDQKALYIINIGANDVFAIESGAVPAAAVPAYETNVVNTLAGTVQYLDAAGATRILVTGIPNTDAVGFGLDALLQAKLTAIQPGLTHAMLDRFSYQSFFARLSADPAKFGVAPFTHLPSDGCFSHLSPPATADCSGFFSVDGTHPIAPIQAAIFREVAHDTGIGTVPEPAAWTLMIAGFAAVGSAVRRRRALVAA